MDKKKQIEEMASDIDYACVELTRDQRVEVARALTVLSYRKVPEDGVLLVGKDLKQYKQFLDFKNDFTIFEVIERECAKAREETIRKFAKLLIEDRQSFDVYEKDSEKLCDKAYIITESFVEDICKKLMEVKE